jgi:gamma-tubulin complex component 5
MYVIHLECLTFSTVLQTAALHRTIVSILDMCLHFSEGFVTFAGDTTATLDVSRQSLNLKRHRSRRQQRQRRNVIGFSQFLQDDDILSSEDEDDEEECVIDHSVSMLGNSTTDTEGDFYSRVERMSSELDGLIRFLRRGVESLAGGTSDAAPAYGVLAFALEDWDI